MKVVVVVLLFEALPFAVLTNVVSSRRLCRRSRFWLRLIGVVIVMLLPDLAALLIRPDEQTAGVLLWLGFMWGLTVAVAAAFLLFDRGGPDPGPGDDGGQGPDSGDSRPTPPAPIGGIPLPDAEPSSTRLRDHHPLPRVPRPRRPTRRRERQPTRLISSVSGRESCATGSRRWGDSRAAWRSGPAPRTPDAGQLGAADETR